MEDLRQNVGVLEKIVGKVNINDPFCDKLSSHTGEKQICASFEKQCS